MAKCSICGKEIPAFKGKIMLKGGEYACFDCVKKAGHNPWTWIKNLSTTSDMLRAEIEGSYPDKTEEKESKISSTMQVSKSAENKIAKSKTVIKDPAKRSIIAKQENAPTDDFTPDISFNKRFFIDTQHELFQLPKDISRRIYRDRTYRFTDLIEYEYIEDGGTITSGGLSSAVVGGALFGQTGAIVGGLIGKKKTVGFVQQMVIKLKVNDAVYPVEYINLNPLNQRLSRNSSTYKKNLENANQIITYLDKMLNISKRETNEEGVYDPANEIMKYKKLLDADAITEEEYNQKKKQLLKL